MKNLFKFGTREIVFGAIGAALYGVLSYATSFIALPALGNISFRPAVVIPIFFSIAFGPWVGLISGLVGNILGDFMFGGFWWAWDLGNGIMGFLPGLITGVLSDFSSKASLIKSEIGAIVAPLVGMLVPSLLEIWLSGITFSAAILGYWLPAAGSNIVTALILLPIVMLAYDGIAKRSAR